MPENNRQKRNVLAVRRAFLFCLFIVITTLVVYYPVKDYDFVNYDDPMYVADNYAIRAGFTWDTVIWCFTEGTTVTNYFAPLTWLSIALDYQLYGMNAGGYHVTNLILHLANSILIFLVFLKMTGKFWQSVFVSSLFALHPLHVESVAWITERKDVLSAFFWFLTMYVYLNYVKHAGWRWYVAVLACFTMGLMAKPMLITLPFVLLLVDYWPLGRFHADGPPEFSLPAFKENRHSPVYLIVEKIPFFLITAVFSVITYTFQKEGDALPSLGKITVLTRLQNVLISYVEYLRQMFWPLDLAVIYPYPQKPSTGYALLALLILVSFSLFAFRNMRQFPYIIVGWLWYIGTLVPVIGLVVIGSHVRADRYTYVPYIGLFIIMAWGISTLMEKRKEYRNYLIAFSVAFLILLMILSRIQLGFWKNSIALFSHCLDVTSENYVGENNLGLALKEEEMISAAIEHYSNALRINPLFDMGYLNMGVALAALGEQEEAERCYHKALLIKPEWAVPYCNIGNIRFRQGRISEAFDYYNKALRIDPNYVEALNGLGGVLVRKGDLDEAVICFRKALRLKQDSEVIRNNLYKVLEHKKKHGAETGNSAP